MLSGEISGDTKILCDNMTVVNVINEQKYKDKDNGPIMPSLQFSWLALICSRAKHLEGENNTAPDAVLQSHAVISAIIAKGRLLANMHPTNVVGAFCWMSPTWRPLL